MSARWASPSSPSSNSPTSCSSNSPSSASRIVVKDPFGQIESVKSVNDLYVPVAGEIVARNDALEKDPALVSADPYGKGWMIKIKLASKGDYDKLLTPEQYEKQIAAHGH